ncbi:PHD finger protein rhinoceros [Anticarsia gemmatalis]|uniref:PHD finger protein rhinoceros n=1 Tax=Anticarsia gemmatalis TaxID=129554 RepID=UPI003F76B4A2
MSLRGTKRASGMRGEEAGASKRRRTEPDQDALWQLRPVSDLKMSAIYNRSASEAPAELFRKDLISAMKLPDNEPLTPSSYWIITDTWKQDWERGVQVPVNPDSLPAPKVEVIDNPAPPNFQEFKLPKDKYVHLTRDAHFSAEKHILSTTPARAEAACGYDLDATDTAWLKLLNAERARAGAAPVSEDQLEKVIEELEVRTWDKIQAIIKSEEGLGIEYDENVICDVCRSPESEDGNEMVFCDSCNICVHQACYGITVIPDGQWLCRPCGDGVRPSCVLCPNHGGAMKCTPSGHKWAHVSCVLWIPEVSIGCAEIMEPITKISSIPASRWSLVCVLCRNRKGACIQCSVKTCKTAYHVTCAFKHGLEMRAIIEDESADDGVKLRSYCQKHSVNNKKEKCPGSGSEEEEVKRKRRKDMTSEEKTQARAARLKEIEREFDRHVSVKDISTHLLDVDQDAINYIYNYWKIKRRAGHNRPLLPPKSDDTELLTHRQEQADLDKMKMFVQLRQDLERVRNLCYMVSRREKLSRSFFRMREQTFHKQVAVLSSDANIPEPELTAIIEANHGPSIYDRLYSHPNAPDHKNDFDELLARIAPSESGDEKKKDRNGLVKGSKSSNPYKKHYVNGSRRSGSMYSGLSSEESAPEISRTRFRKAIGSSTEDESKKTATSPKKKVSPKATKVKKKMPQSPKKTERKRKKPQSKALIESSSEDEALKSKMKKDRSRSRTLQQMEKEMTAAAGKLGASGTDSDDLMPIRSTRNNKFPIDIYSDSSEDNKSDVKLEKAKADKIKTDKEKKSERSRPDKSPGGNDSQQSLPRTKAAMKEFIPSQPEKKTAPAAAPPEEEKPAPKKRGRKPSNKEKKVPTTKTERPESDDDAKNKENIKFSKQKDHPTDLIVPQRQAAKKASENMRSTTVVKKDEPTTETKPAAESKQSSGDDVKVKTPVKSTGKSAKGKEIKDGPGKVGKKKSKDQEKETIAYVPQRQAAKKAAAHIKSGLGTKAPATEADDKKKDEKSDPIKSPPSKKEETKSSKSADKESSSSSSNSSSSSYSSSSSSEEEPEKPSIKPTAKAREIKPAISTRQPSMFSPPGTRPTVDLPFLDKVSRPLSSTSASSDSDSSKESDRSGSGSPYPKRPRRRRKVKSISTDASPRKAPDKKLKTSERRSECRVSPTLEGEEPSRPNVARSATRARTRSVTSGGNLPNKSDARSRKPSKDDSGIAVGPNKTPKESSQPSELPTAERKKDEEVKKESKTEPAVVEVTKNDVKTKPSKASKRNSESNEEKDKPATPDIRTPPNKVSPRKSTEAKQTKLSNRRMSVKEPVAKDRLSSEESREPPAKKDRRLSRLEVHNTTAERTNLSPVKKARESLMEKPTIEATEKKSPVRINDDYHDNDKHWLPKAPSPNAIPPPVEKPGGNEKYMTDDKSMDSDYTDKSSVKMIAKIQANLNENTMIKSPKTPMDARTVNIDHLEVEAVARNMRKRPTDKKFITQDASHVQGVEISKSAKIPSSMNPYPNRMFTSPHTRQDELFNFELMAVDDGFNHDDIIKPFATYPEFFFKEDSKEQGVQETLNLVDRLRMQLTKKVPVDNSTQDEPIVINDDSVKDEDDNDNAVPCSNAIKDDDDLDHAPAKIAYDRPASRSEQSPPKEIRHTTVNHVTHSGSPPRHLSAKNLVMDNKDYRQHPIPMTSNEKWSATPLVHIDSQSQSANDRKYDSYGEDAKEPMTVQSDVQSEVADTISLSKQSDDSQSHLSVVDHSVQGDNDQELTQDNQNYENNDSMIHSDCATISSPYVSQEKWRESKITTRRSSASSTNSEGSVCSQKVALKSRLNAIDSRPGNVMPEIDTYPPIPAYSRPVEPSMPLNQYTTYPPDASPFLSTLPLFTGPCAVPLPSPGPPMYVPYTATSLLPPKQFPLSFSTSSQNLALTTAMIAPPTPKPMDSPRDEIDVTGSDKFSIHVPSSPSVSVDSYSTETNSNRPTTKMSNDSNETMSSLIPQDSKSPPKLSKSATRFPGKSPGKSPGISPKQSDAPKGTKRASNRSNRSQRGRGRSKSRGQSGFPPVDYLGNSIQSKLVGTVYDFNEEIANDGVDLKALRDKRKSIDVRDDRKSEYKDSSQSPRVITPPHSKRPPMSDSKDTKPSTPDPDDPNSSPSKGFSQVAPVLPGPVDMRTYQPFENPVPTTGETYNSSSLMVFASGTADQHLAEIDVEVEKQLHSALMASNPPSGSPGRHHDPPGHNDPPKDPPATPQLPKVSLSDSRNQLKVKIKGPFLDANYSASCSSQPVVPPPPVPTHDLNTPIASTSSGTGGSGNLRRMRKKELLRQYWTQDMNMDDPSTSAAQVVPPPAAPSPLTRAVITIPKAVASMTSIPTREDYKTVDTPVEKKKRKTTSGLSRELRHLEVSMNDDVDPSDDVKLSTIAGTSGTQTHKRRGRNATKSSASATVTSANAGTGAAAASAGASASGAGPSTSRGSTSSPVTPKLKIKIGANTAAVQQVPPAPSPVPPAREPTPPREPSPPPRAFSPQPGPSTEDPSDSNRPPKKRTLPKPSLEDLRRESMKYRRLVMAGFNEDELLQFQEMEEERARKNKAKSEKRKKKKDKKSGKLEIVNSESGDSATKLIIKIKRASDTETSRPSRRGSSGPPATTEQYDPFDYDPAAPDPLAIDPPSSESSSGVRRVRTDKVTPIRLKITRSSEGSGYVMKEPSQAPPAETAEPAAGAATSPVPLPVR